MRLYSEKIYFKSTRKFIEQSTERITLLVSALTLWIVSTNAHATRKYREKSAIGEATSAVTSWRRDAVGDETSRTMLVLLRSSATEKRPIIIRLALSYSISVAACYRLRSASLALVLALALAYALAFAVARSTAGRLVRGTIHNAI